MLYIRGAVLARHTETCLSVLFSIISLLLPTAILVHVVVYWDMMTLRSSAQMSPPRERLVTPARKRKRSGARSSRSHAIYLLSRLALMPDRQVKEMYSPSRSSCC